VSHMERLVASEGAPSRLEGPQVLAGSLPVVLLHPVAEVTADAVPLVSPRVPKDQSPVSTLPPTKRFAFPLSSRLRPYPLTHLPPSLPGVAGGCVTLTGDAQTNLLLLEL
jgi:hypothetical protein